MLVGVIVVVMVIVTLNVKDIRTAWPMHRSFQEIKLSLGFVPIYSFCLCLKGNIVIFLFPFSFSSVVPQNQTTAPNPFELNYPDAFYFSFVQIMWQSDRISLTVVLYRYRVQLVLSLLIFYGQLIKVFTNSFTQNSQPHLFMTQKCITAGKLA